MIRAIITDIEGTTSDIQFVKQVLFPYARARLGDILQQAASQREIALVCEQLRQEINQPAAGGSELLAVLNQFMDEDRKSTALKQLQGIIWREGYQNGELQGHLYQDVSPQLHAWHQRGIRLGVYSSGSQQAQQLLFAYSQAGDLGGLFRDYFDTRIGHKRQVDSYRCIAQHLQLPASHILFLSDTYQELDAAAAAGWQTCQLVRGVAEAQRTHPQVSGFDQIDLHQFSHQ
jgi:enolase-phosphatase E1